jgi:tryptophan halogenase
VLDFIKLHYCLTQRTDNDFWIDNTRPESIPDSLQALLEMWKTRAPDPFDFGTVHDSFEVFNYQYVLYGMGFKTDLSANLSAYPHLEAARREFARLKNAAGRATAAMPDHRGLLDEIYRSGFRGPAPQGAALGAAAR